MTSGRINQVRTVCGMRRTGPAGVLAGGGDPLHAHAPLGPASCQARCTSLAAAALARPGRLLVPGLFSHALGWTRGQAGPPCVKPWQASQYCQAAYCNSDKGVGHVGHSQLAPPWTSRLRAATARLMPGACPDATVHLHQDTDAPWTAASLGSALLA